MKKQAQLLALGTLFVFFTLHHPTLAQSEDAPRYEVGAQFSSLTMRDPSFANDFRTEPGFGGRFTVNITDYLAAEAQVDFYPNDNRSGSDFAGGRMTTGLFGVKAGKRYERFGIYAKARPGFVRFERTFVGFTDVTPTPQFPDFVPQFRGRTEFATDIGGVLEFYPTRRIVTRFDIGDTIIRFKERTTNFPVVNFGTMPPTVTLVTVPLPGQTRHNLQFSAGIGFRF